MFQYDGYSYQINEWEDENSIKYYSQGEIGNFNDMIPTSYTCYANRLLEDATDLFEAKARLIEKIIVPTHINKGAAVKTEMYLRELGNLPLLIGFFKNDIIKEIFSKILKDG